jgi:tetratricopeptide (TPR) repeat protein
MKVDPFDSLVDLKQRNKSAQPNNENPRVPHQTLTSLLNQTAMPASSILPNPTHPILPNPTFNHPILPSHASTPNSLSNQNPLLKNSQIPIMLQNSTQPLHLNSQQSAAKSNTDTYTAWAQLDVLDSVNNAPDIFDVAFLEPKQDNVLGLLADPVPPNTNESQTLPSVQLLPRNQTESMTHAKYDKQSQFEPPAILSPANSLESKLKAQKAVKFDSSPSINVIDDRKTIQIQEIIAMGFDEESATRAYEIYDGNVQAAIDHLLEKAENRGNKDKLFQSAAAFGMGVLKNAKSVFEYSKKLVSEKANSKMTTFENTRTQEQESYRAQNSSEKPAASNFIKPVKEDSFGSDSKQNERADVSFDAKLADVGQKQKPVAAPILADLIDMGGELAPVKQLENVPSFDTIFSINMAATKKNGEANSTGVNSNLKQNTGIQPTGLFSSPEANRFKDLGNDSFKRGQFSEAVEFYTKGISNSTNDAAMLINLHNNRSSAYLKTGEYRSCVDDCNRVFELDADNTKALLRRASALELLEDYQSALEDFRRLLAIEPSAAASSGLTRCNQALNKSKANKVYVVFNIAKFLAFVKNKYPKK